MRQNQDTQKRSNLKSFIIIGLLLLLVAVIGFGGYTLSKYLTSKEETGKANVAKWGFTVDADASNLFGTKYSDGSVVADSATDNLTVSATSKAVAPGTSGSMKFSIKGSAEVLAQIKFELSITSDIVLTYTNEQSTETTYAPVKWTLTKNNETSPIVENGTLAAVKTAIEQKSTTYQANSTAIDDTYTLSWAWDFDDSGKGTNDVLDTTLGMIANNATATDGKINGVTVVSDKTETVIDFTLKISVTQLQNAQ